MQNFTGRSAPTSSRDPISTLEALKYFSWDVVVINPHRIEPGQPQELWCRYLAYVKQSRRHLVQNHNSEEMFTVDESAFVNGLPTPFGPAQHPRITYEFHIGNDEIYCRFDPDEVSLLYCSSRERYGSIPYVDHRVHIGKSLCSKDNLISVIRSLFWNSYSSICSPPKITDFDIIILEGVHHGNKTAPVKMAGRPAVWTVDTRDYWPMLNIIKACSNLLLGFNTYYGIVASGKLLKSFRNAFTYALAQAMSYMLFHTKNIRWSQLSALELHDRRYGDRPSLSYDHRQKAQDFYKGQRDQAIKRREQRKLAHSRKNKSHDWSAEPTVTLETYSWTQQPTPLNQHPRMRSFHMHNFASISEQWWRWRITNELRGNVPIIRLIRTSIQVADCVYYTHACGPIDIAYPAISYGATRLLDTPKKKVCLDIRKEHRTIGDPDAAHANWYTPPVTPAALSDGILNPLRERITTDRPRTWRDPSYAIHYQDLLDITEANAFSEFLYGRDSRAMLKISLVTHLVSRLDPLCTSFYGFAERNGQPDPTGSIPEYLANKLSPLRSGCGIPNSIIKYILHKIVKYFMKMYLEETLVHRRLLYSIFEIDKNASRILHQSSFEFEDWPKRRNQMDMDHTMGQQGALP
jgi:hypothetical protein